MIVTVEAGVRSMLSRGHPWIYKAAIRSIRGGSPRTGDAVSVVGPEGEVVGFGLFDADSPIAVRLYGAKKLDVPTMMGRIEAAFAKRDKAFDPAETTAYRMCHGEGDRVPGLVVDRYGPVAVVRTDGAAMAAWLERLAGPMRKALEPRGVTALLARVEAGAPTNNEDKTRLVWGGPVPATIDVREHGVVFEVDLARGQKTGAFLDQRENRRRVRRLAAGRARVLNLFSYAGGFSIAAALGGARVTSVDIAARAHASAQRSFRKNGLDPGRHEFVTADAFAFLDGAKRRRDSFDLVVSDPPSFAPNEKSKRRALSAYQRLHRAAAGVLAPDGVLCAASCSSHVSMEEFLATLDDVTLERSDLAVHETFGPPWDHPTLASFPEGRYLKFVVLR